MPCEEITKAIEWSYKSNSTDDYPVVAYFTLHSGLPSTEPIDSISADQVWYAEGRVYAQSNASGSFLSGNLGQVSTNKSVSKMDVKPELSVNVWIHADGSFQYQELLKGKPIGGFPPKSLVLDCVEDVLLTGVDGNQVIAVGVARLPSVPIPPG